uniref:cAMP Regulatory protein n=1 Tax=Streptomyces sp. TP-A0584 TaxID=314563 RepID=A0A6S4QDU4_9ACTN|nr:cAMP Regulatory protein [Streptomyces sp. TP-A0584]
MSPIVSERIWALPISGAAVKFLQYLIHRSDFGGELPIRQKDMAEELRITPQAVSNHIAALGKLNIVLRPQNEARQGNSYRLHPFAAKYETPEDLEAAFRHAIQQIKARELPNLNLPAYTAVPPAEGRPSLKVA